MELQLSLLPTSLSGPITARILSSDSGEWIDNGMQLGGRPTFRHNVPPQFPRQTRTLSKHSMRKRVDELVSHLAYSSALKLEAI
jgi:hypothetical protein